MDAPVEQAPPPEAATNDPPVPAPPLPVPLATQPPENETPRPHPPARDEEESEQRRDDDEGGSDGTESDHREESDSTDSDGEPSFPWQPINEDKSEAAGDELEYIMRKGFEPSGTDKHYWEKLTFFELDDPDLVPVESGTIDWMIDRFNGTAENPNTELVMRSPTVTIGGHDWRIKFYPRGHRSEYLSAYLENVTMQQPEWEATEEFVDPPFPFLKGQQRVRRRRSVAAQLSIVMYNPAEPRVFEYKAEAHQFHKECSDYGWRYFTQYPRYEIHLRQHLQRQAILRNDRLAFRAYIRVVKDPTGCKWEHGTPSPNMTAMRTGLRPFTKSLQYIAAAVPLLHFQPFREWTKSLRGHNCTRVWLQSLLLKMYLRKRSSKFGAPGSKCPGDVMEMLWRLTCRAFYDFPEGAEFAKFKELVGAFHPEKGAACGANRLNTKDHDSIQKAVDKHVKVIACPQLLTLELQRQEHDKKTRKWKKLTNKVEVSDHLNVQGVHYTLFAFVTHCGSLASSRYVPYVRPRGIGKGWYAYHDGRVTILTETEARGKHSGFKDRRTRDPSPGSGYDSPFSQYDDHQDAEVTCAVMYVRDDVADQAFNFSDVEEWQPPGIQPEDYSEACKTALHEYFDHEQLYRALQSSGGNADRDRLAELANSIERAAGSAVPPAAPLMDGEDVIMRDADDDSQYSIEGQSTDPINLQMNTGTHDWLGRHYYEGEYDADKREHGGGHLIDINGDEYLGQFKDGMKSGHGKMIYSATGNEYEGDWLDGLPHGKGKLTERSGNVYEGDFKEGRKTGQFVLRGTVTEDDRTCCTICFDKEISTAFFDCGHVVACRECADRIDNCPVCRKRVIQRLQLYGVKVAVD